MYLYAVQMAPRWAAFKRAARQEDLFVFISRGLLYVGFFFLTLLKFKAGKSLNFSDAFFAASFIFLILSRRPPPRAPKTPAWYVGAFIFLLSALIASTQAMVVSASLIVVINAIFVFFVLQYLWRQQLNNTRRMQWALGAFVLGATISALVAILQVEFGILLPSGASAAGSIGGNWRAIGLSTQPNLAGIAFALGIIFSLGLLLELRGNLRRFFIGCLVVQLMALLLSGSISGLLALIAGVIVFVIARGVPLKTIVLILLAVAAVYVLVFGAIDRGSHLDPITRIQQATNPNSGTGGGTLSLREDTWKAAWTGIQQKPVWGHGLDQTTLAVYFAPYLYEYFAPHNLIFLYWFGGGIFMLLALAIMVGSSFSHVLSGRRLGVRSGNPLRDVILGACVADLVFSMMGPELVDRWFWMPFLFALCFREHEVPLLGVRRTTALPLAAPDAPVVAATNGAPVGNGAPVANGAPRRVSGTVGRGRHAAPQDTTS
jgi:O-antigen ligase